MFLVGPRLFVVIVVVGTDNSRILIRNQCAMLFKHIWLNERASETDIFRLSNQQDTPADPKVNPQFASSVCFYILFVVVNYLLPRMVLNECARLSQSLSATFREVYSALPHGTCG